MVPLFSTRKEISMLSTKLTANIFAGFSLLALFFSLVEDAKGEFAIGYLTNDNQIVTFDPDTGSILSTTNVSGGIIGLTYGNDALYGLTGTIGSNQLHRINPINGQSTFVGGTGQAFNGARYIDFDPTTGLLWGGGNGGGITTTIGTHNVNSGLFTTNGTIASSPQSISQAYGLAIDPTTGTQYLTSDPGELVGIDGHRYNGLYELNGLNATLVGTTVRRTGPPGAALLLELGFTPDGRLFGVGGNGDPANQMLWEINKNNGSIVNTFAIPSTSAFRGLAFSGITAVPEPSTLAPACIGAIAWIYCRRRRRATHSNRK
jgi:hypothetical protein